MPLILPGNVASATAAVGFDVDNSCRFNDDDSAYMHKTQAAPTNNKKWTFSCWFKRSGFTTGVPQHLVTCYIDGNNLGKIQIATDDSIHFYDWASAAYTGRLQTNRLFRDPSAWYHIVCVWDSDNGTAGDRMKMYINGTEETSFATDTNPSSGAASVINTDSEKFELGAANDAAYFDGYTAEVAFIDGQALTPTSFGEFDEDSPTIWKPIKVSGLTFGNNGFYLDFKDSANLGNDANGGTDLTEVNLAAADQSQDSPSNSFATLNPLENYWQAATFSNGNNTAVTATDKYAPVQSTFGMTAGKWYWEVKPTAGGTDHLIGICSTQVLASINELGNWANDYGYYASNGYLRTDNSASSYGNTYVNDDIIGVALDLTNNKLYFAKNGTWQDSGDPTSGATGTGAVSITAVGSTSLGVYFSGQGYWGTTGTYNTNFGNGCFGDTAVSSAEADGNGYGLFEYAPPSGYLALCTKNLGSDGG